MELIKLNTPSLHSPNETIHNLLLKQLSIIHPTIPILEIFKHRNFTNVVLKTNIHLINLIEGKPTVEDIIGCITLLKDAMCVVAKELRNIHEEVHHKSDHISQKAIYISEVHNVYGIFILEMNSLIKDTELHLRDFKLSTRTIDNLFNDPNIKPEPIQYNDKINDSPPSCCWKRKLSNGHII